MGFYPNTQAIRAAKDSEGSVGDQARFDACIVCWSARDWRSSNRALFYHSLSHLLRRQTTRLSKGGHSRDRRAGSAVEHAPPADGVPAVGHAQPAD